MSQHLAAKAGGPELEETFVHKGSSAQPKCAPHRLMSHSPYL